MTCARHSSSCWAAGAVWGAEETSLDAWAATEAAGQSELPDAELSFQYWQQGTVLPQQSAAGPQQDPAEHIAAGGEQEDADPQAGAMAAEGGLEDTQAGGRGADAQAGTAAGRDGGAGGQAGEAPEGGPRAGRPPRHWACRLCTFGDNPRHSLRCEVCQHLRGTTLESVTGGADSQQAQRGGREAGRSAGQLSPWLAGAGRQPGAGRPVEGRKPPVPRATRQRRGISDLFSEPQAPLLPAPVSSEQLRPQQMQAQTGADLWKQFDAQTCRWQCARCLAWIHAAQQTEHEDYHFAFMLQGEPASAVKRLKLTRLTAAP